MNKTTDVSSPAFADNNNNTYFLCSIETSLTIDDITFILNDLSIDTQNIDFIEPEGNFRKKKIIKLVSSNRVSLFKFRLAFNKSSLNGTWFFNNSPPKFKAFNPKRNPTQQSLTITELITIFNIIIILTQ